MKYIYLAVIFNTAAIVLGLLNAAYFDGGVFIFVLNWVIIGSAILLIAFGIKSERSKNATKR